MILARDLIPAIEQHTGRQGKQQGHNVRLLCPGHDDHNPSLDVAEGPNGEALVTCRSHGCTLEAIVAAVGLDVSSNGAGSEWTPHGPMVVSYPYVDEDGRLLYEVCRTADKDFPQRRPDHTSKTGWRWKLGDVRRVVFQLPDVIAAVEAGEIVYIVEGEKDALRLRKLGIVATCNSGGAGQWDDSYSAIFKGATVVVVADRDAKGEKHARQVARSLEAHGAHVELRQAAIETKGADVSDHLEAGYSLDELVEYRPNPLTDDVDEPSLLTRTLDEFADVDEPGAEAVVGTADGPLIAEGNDAMGYGDGGVGKTTLFVDLSFHLAAGDAWLGISIPKPRRVLLIENEGPRPLFRKKLARKRDAWKGSPIEDRIRVFEHPWGRFTFADEQCRQRLADEIAEHEIDVVIVGPVTSVGMDVGGTIPEVRAFIALVDDVRDLSGRPIATLLVHHENKGGQVSGAWEGVGDTLLHVQQQGHGRMRLLIQKARWSSEMHLTALQLVWADGDSFEIEQKTELDDSDVAELLVDVIRADPGAGWTKVEKATPGVSDERRRHVRDGLLKGGVIVNVGKGEHGDQVILDHCPERRAAHLYPADDPAIRHLRRDSDADQTQTASLWGEGPSERLRRASRPYRDADVDADPHPASDLDQEEIERLAERAREWGIAGPEVVDEPDTEGGSP